MRPVYLSLLLLILFSNSKQQALYPNYVSYNPDPWEIERIGKLNIKPYDDKHKNNHSLLGSVENNKSCFGSGEGDYRLVNFTDIKLDILSVVEDKFNKVIHQYLSKYCQRGLKCEVDKL